MEQLVYVSDKARVVLDRGSYRVDLKEGAKQSDLNRVLQKCGLKEDEVEVKYD